MRMMISQILENASQQPSKAERIAYLRNNYNQTLGMLLKYAYDPRIKFILPEGEPPYKTNPYPGQEGALYSEARRLYLFVDGGNPNLAATKREMLFVQMLEMLPSADAKLVLAIKDKKIPYKGITEKVVKEAFPGLLGEEVVEETQTEA